MSLSGRPMQVQPAVGNKQTRPGCKSKPRYHRNDCLAQRKSILHAEIARKPRGMYLCAGEHFCDAKNYDDAPRRKIRPPPTGQVSVVASPICIAVQPATHSRDSAGHDGQTRSLPPSVPATHEVLSRLPSVYPCPIKILARDLGSGWRRLLTGTR